jgi:hypothetical protein
MIDHDKRAERALRKVVPREAEAGLSGCAEEIELQAPVDRDARRW